MRRDRARQAGRQVFERSAGTDRILKTERGQPIVGLFARESGRRSKRFEQRPVVERLMKLADPAAVLRNVAIQLIHGTLVARPVSHGQCQVRPVCRELMGL